jgi:hypothetical protein
MDRRAQQTGRGYDLPDRTAAVRLGLARCHPTVSL